jgi:hypothetical protein
MASGEERLFDFLPEQAVPERVDGGVPRLRFAERMQTRWRPDSLDGLLPDDHLVRLVWSFVEGLDVTALLATIKAVDPSGGPADSAGALVVCHRGGDWQRPRGCAVV